MHPRALNFPHLATGESDTLSVRMENNGGKTLNVALTTASHADFSFEPSSPILLEPNTFGDVEVVYKAWASNAVVSRNRNHESVW